MKKLLLLLSSYLVSVNISFANADDDKTSVEGPERQHPSFGLSETQKTVLSGEINSLIHKEQANENPFGSPDDAGTPEDSGRLMHVAGALSKLTLGGYGEAVCTRNFYSDRWQRYTNAENYKDAGSHGRFDLPHVVFIIGYDFGRGWTFGSEIEFEHGGTESAVEIEAEETGEYESEVERGGEVALEQFWIQKSISRALNIRMGHIIVPVGLTNRHHLPTEFFTVYRPEGENTVLPCTWHETGISIWGRTKNWRYEIQFLPGLDADRFDSEGFISGGAGSPYEFKIANSYAGVFRLDNYAVKGLRVGLSGYFGHSFNNSLTKNTKYENCKGEVMIGTVDFHYSNCNVTVRGYFDWAHLNDSEEITRFNKSMPAASPSPKTAVASDAAVSGIEAGYDLFAHIAQILLKRNATVCLLLFCLQTNRAAGKPASEPGVLPREIAARFGDLYVLYNDRICPLQTLAKDFTVKLYGRSSYKGLTPEQVFPGCFRLLSSSFVRFPC